MASVKAIKKSKEITESLTTRKLLFIIGAFSFLIYLNTIPNGYNIDDDLVTINHKLTSNGIKAIPEIFSTPYYKDAAGNQYEYRPVTLASFALEHQLFGDNTHISHLINVLIYIALSLVLFLTLAKLFTGYSYLLPFTITLLFVAHPLHTEAVASIKNRDELLCFAGGILSFYYSLLFIENRKIKNYVLYVFFFVFALLSKKSILPFVLLIPVAHVIFKRTGSLKLFLISLPLSICAGLFWPLDNIIQKTGFALIPVIIPFAVSVLLYNRDLLIQPVYVFFNALKKIPAIIKNSSSKTMVVKGNKLHWILPPLSLAAGVLFCHYDLKILIILYLFFLALLFLLASSGVRVAIFYGVILFTGTVCYFYSGTYLILMLFVAGISFFFTSEKKIKELIPLFLIIILTVLMKLIGNKMNFPIMALLPFLFFIFYETKWKIISIGVMIVAIIFSLFTSFDITLDLIFYILSLSALIFLYFFPKFIKSHSSFFFLMGLALLMLVHLGMNWNRLPSNEIVYRVTEQVREIQTSVEKVKIVPASGRKLNFVEMPLSNSDPLSVRVGTSFTVLGKYLKLLVFPYHLGFYYGYAYIEPVPWNNYMSLISIIIHLLLVFAFFYFFKEHTVFSFGIFFYLLCISEFSNLAVPVAGVMADRLTFVASAGFCMAIGYGLLILMRTDLKSATAKISFSNKWSFVAIAVLVMYSAKTFSRNFQWKDQVTLMRNDIKHLEKSVQANNLLAFYLVEKSFKAKSQAEKESHLKEAIIHFRKAVELYPQADFAWHDLGQTYLLLNNMNDALPAFLKAIEIDSTYLNALTKAAGIYSKQNKYKEAAFYYEKVIANDSTNIPAYSSLSQAYFMQNNFEKAIETNLKAIKIAPENYDPLANMGKIYFATGDKKNALVYFEKAYRVNSNDKNLINAIAGIYKELGENDKAEFYSSKANQPSR